MNSCWHVQRGILVFLTFCAYLPSWAQEVADTVLLGEVQIVAFREEDYLPGGFTKALDKNQLPSTSVNGAITNELPVFFNEYGATGQLASSNLRGLGAARTSLRWNGMEINSFTLGQSDFNLVNASTIGSIGISTGAASSLWGNGALGGTINLQSTPFGVEKSRFRFQQSLGSFGNFASSAGYVMAQKKWQSNTSLSHQSARNDFPYQFGDSTFVQNNAAYRGYSIAQDVYFQPKSNHLLALQLWYNFNDREVQPAMSNPEGDDQLVDRNFRSLLSWQYLENQLTMTTKIGFTRDHQVFNGQDPVIVNRWFGEFQAEWMSGSAWRFKGGANLNYLLADVSAYGEVVNEVRNDLFFSGRWTPKTGLILVLNARLPMVNGNTQAFAPSFHTSYQILSGDKGGISFNGQLSRSFRLPTLNDRFWNPGGNPDLLPEIGRNAELGFDGQLKLAQNLTYEASIRYFYHNVDNWIIWRPGGAEVDEEGNRTSFWFPDNIRKVEAQGVEFYNTFSYKMMDQAMGVQLEVHATYTRAVNKEQLSDFDRSVNKQLPFTPKWVSLARLTFDYRNWVLSSSLRYVGERYREANNELPPIDSFTLLNLSIGKHWNLGESRIGGTIQVNNLTDENYQSYENRAMPGRNYMITVKFEH